MNSTSTRSYDNTLPPIQSLDTTNPTPLRPTLTGHDLMSLFPPAQGPTTSRWFGQQEREYLSSSRDETARSWRASPCGDAASSSSDASSYRSSPSRGSKSGASSSTTSSLSSSPVPSPPSAIKAAFPAPTNPSIHVFSARSANPRDSIPSGANSSSRSSMPPTQIQAHSIPQGSGDAQFSILRMPLESFSNPNATTSQFTEFRAHKVSSSGIEVDNMFSEWNPSASSNKRRAGKHTKRVVRVQ